MVYFVPATKPGALMILFKHMQNFGVGYMNLSKRHFLAAVSTWVGGMATTTKALAALASDGGPSLLPGPPAPLNAQAPSAPAYDIVGLVVCIRKPDRHSQPGA